MLQVAALLVSASYGIGFLFGSGQMALGHGMGGAIYGMATAIGMVALAALACRIRRLGLPVWDLFGEAYGLTVQRAVALLSLLWMGGVLAAQIQGGVAVAGLLGADRWTAGVVVVALLYGASRMDLRVACGVFTGCLLLSAGMLLVALWNAGGLPVYLSAGPAFVDDLSTFSAGRVVTVVVAVAVLVCTGADYHQFVLASRGPAAAVVGCVLAAMVLVLLAFLPPAVVVAMQTNQGAAAIGSSSQVIPDALARTAGNLVPGSGPLMLLALSSAALGSGAAIARAMASALASALPGRHGEVRDAGPRDTAAALLTGGLLASTGQGIVDTMVCVNIIYIASVGCVFALLLRGVALPRCHARAVMSTGLLGAFLGYAVSWLGWSTTDRDTLALVIGLGASALVLAVLRGLPAPQARVEPIA
jgi:SSS family solute:Na+ symporter